MDSQWNVAQKYAGRGIRYKDRQKRLKNNQFEPWKVEKISYTSTGLCEIAQPNSIFD